MYVFPKSMIMRLSTHLHRTSQPLLRVLAAKPRPLATPPRLPHPGRLSRQSPSPLPSRTTRVRLLLCPRPTVGVGMPPRLQRPPRPRTKRRIRRKGRLKRIRRTRKTRRKGRIPLRLPLRLRVPESSDSPQAYPKRLSVRGPSPGDCSDVSISESTSGSGIKILTTM